MSRPTPHRRSQLEVVPDDHDARDWTASAASTTCRPSAASRPWSTAAQVALFRSHDGTRARRRPPRPVQRRERDRPRHRRQPRSTAEPRPSPRPMYKQVFDLRHRRLPRRPAAPLPVAAASTHAVEVRAGVVHRRTAAPACGPQARSAAVSARMTAASLDAGRGRPARRGRRRTGPAAGRVRCPDAARWSGSWSPRARCEDVTDLVADGRWTVAGADCEAAGATSTTVWLVHAATGDPATDAQVCRWATSRRLWSAGPDAAEQGRRAPRPRSRTPGWSWGWPRRTAPTPPERPPCGTSSPAPCTARRSTCAGAVSGASGPRRLGGARRRRARRPGPAHGRGRRALSEADVVVVDRLGAAALS